MKFIFCLIIFVVITSEIYPRQIGETEITTDEGIEVYQEEKFYLLKKNVKIISDSFVLKADEVKINFDENLYDITNLTANGNVTFNSEAFKIIGSGDILIFKVKTEELLIKGSRSEIKIEDLKMLSDGIIEINNLNGNFNLNGPKSRLISSDTYIEAKFIDGILKNKDNKKVITFLNVLDEDIAYVKNIDTEMYAKKLTFDYDLSTIELFEDVTIMRDGENISGDYGVLDTKNNSYKIQSNNNSKVKVIIQNNE